MRKSIMLEGTNENPGSRGSEDELRVKSIDTANRTGTTGTVHYSTGDRRLTITGSRFHLAVARPTAFLPRSYTE